MNNNGDLAKESEQSEDTPEKELDQLHESEEVDTEAVLTLSRDEVGLIVELINEKEDKEVPKIKTSTAQELSDKQNSEEDESIDANVDYVSKNGDLSPRQIDNLKSKMQKSIRQVLP
ncbi:hypothetical protein KY285_013103 [Solanum tuberosum]|nr:hypothetical protein KY285_013103 [Solanum tuberosum]